MLAQLSPEALSFLTASPGLAGAVVCIIVYLEWRFLPPLRAIARAERESHVVLSAIGRKAGVETAALDRAIAGFPPDIG